MSRARHQCTNCDGAGHTAQNCESDPPPRAPVRDEIGARNLRALLRLAPSDGEIQCPAKGLIAIGRCVATQGEIACTCPVYLARGAAGLPSDAAPPDTFEAQPPRRRVGVPIFGRGRRW